MQGGRAWVARGGEDPPLPELVIQWGVLQDRRGCWPHPRICSTRAQQRIRTLAGEVKRGDWPVKDSRVCPKCKSSDILPSVRVADRAEGGLRDLSLSFPGPRLAGLFQIPSQQPLAAWVCTRCGYTELYASRPDLVRATAQSASQVPSMSQDLSTTDPATPARSQRTILLLALVLSVLCAGVALAIPLFISQAQ
jgi:predicted nucleic-acid-binding Zn-ribbon protein